jgi:hypothetical protein
MDAGERGFRGLPVRPASSEHLQPQGDRNGVFPDHYSNPIFLSIALITAGYFFLRGGALE